MYLETHKPRDPIDADSAIVLDLIWTLVSEPDDPVNPDPGTPIGHVDDVLARLWLWEAVAEEFADRVVAEPDLEDLVSATSLGALADAMSRALRPEAPHTENIERIRTPAPVA